MPNNLLVWDAQTAAFPTATLWADDEDMKLDTIVDFLDGMLKVKAHGEDSGLKLTGRKKICKIGGAVDLSLYAINKASQAGCDFLFTHHDAWSSTDAELAEKKSELLRQRKISTYVSHDPLDLHSELGTAFSLARALNWHISDSFMNNLGVIAEVNNVSTLEESIPHISATLGNKPYVVPAGGKIDRVGIIAGWGARPEWMSEARAKGATTFLSGEAIHFGKLYAKESGMNLILAGHYATELPAVKVLLDCIWKEFNIETELIKDEISAEL